MREHPPNSPLIARQRAKEDTRGRTKLVIVEAKDAKIERGELRRERAGDEVIVEVFWNAMVRGC